VPPCRSVRSPRAVMTPDAAQVAPEWPVDDLLPPLRAARLLDRVHVWVSPDPPAVQFFTGGWLLLALAARVRDLALPNDSPGMDAAGIVRLGETVGVTITDLASVDAALTAVLDAPSG